MCLQFADFASPQPELLLGQHHDGSTLGRFVGQAGQLRGISQGFGRHVADGHEGCRHTVAHGDSAGLVEQQDVHIAGSLDGPAAHGDHVLADQAIHARDADGRNQAADGGGNQAHQQGDDHRGREPDAGVERQRNQGHAGEQEHQGQSDQENVQGDLVGRLLSGRPFDQGNHSVEKGLAGVGHDSYHDAIREHLGTAGDRRAIAARLADHRS